ncbi:MAG: hypothetical protein WCI93_03070 [bacterium]
MSDSIGQEKIEEQIIVLENQIKELEAGLTIKDDLAENERLYQYLFEQKKYELVEQRAKEKLGDIAKIKELETEIQKAEKKLLEIEKIKELRAQIGMMNTSI